MTRVRWISREGAAVAIIAAVVLAVMIPVTLGIGVAIVQGVTFLDSVARNVSQLQVAVDATLDADADPERAVEFYEALPENYQGIHDFIVRAADSSDAGDAFGSTVRRLEAWIEANSQLIGQRALTTGVGVVSAVLAFFTSLSLFGFGSFLTLFFFFFLSTGYARVLKFGERLLPERNKPMILRLLREMDRVIAAFIRGRLIIAIIQSVLFTAGFYAAGVPAAFILGPFTGFVSIVPYAALVSLPIAVVLLFIEPNAGWQDAWWWTLAGPAVVYFPLQTLDDYVWTPLIQGKETNMETPTILFASIAGGVLAGPFGLLLGIPVAACVKILLNELFWPRIEKWTRGEAEDPLPISRE